jgi:hypothetical protein
MTFLCTNRTHILSNHLAINFLILKSSVNLCTKKQTPMTEIIGFLVGKEVQLLIDAVQMGGQM